MGLAFVFGNGTSRLDVDIDTCRQYGPIYGCNAMYREYSPDVLVATDRPISEAIEKSGYAKTNKFYTRRPTSGSGALQVPQEYFGNSSGPLAVALACLDKHRVIYLVGFDMGPSSTGHFNNVYASTEFYKKASAVPTYTGNWVKQLIKITKDFPAVSFYRIVGSTTAEIRELIGAKNVYHMPMTEFLNRINNTKEL